MSQYNKNFTLNITFNGKSHIFSTDESLTIDKIKELIEEKVFNNSKELYLVYTNENEILSMDNSISSNNKLLTQIKECGNIDLILKLVDEHSINNDKVVTCPNDGKFDSYNKIDEKEDRTIKWKNDCNEDNKLEKRCDNITLSRRRKMSKAVNFGSRFDINKYITNNENQFCESILDTIDANEYKIKYFQLQKELDKQESLNAKDNENNQQLTQEISKQKTKKKNSSKSKKNKKDGNLKSKLKKSKSKDLSAKTENREVDSEQSSDNPTLQEKEEDCLIRSFSSSDLTLNLNSINNNIDEEDSVLSTSSAFSTPRSEPGDGDQFKSKRLEYSTYLGSFSVLHHHEYSREYNEISDDISDSLSSDVDNSERKDEVYKVESAPTTPKYSRSAQNKVWSNRRSTQSEVHRKGTISGNTPKRKFRRAKKVDEGDAKKRINNKKSVIDDIESKKFRLTPLQSELPWTSVSKYKIYRPTIEQNLQDRKPVLGIQKMSMMRQAIFYDTSPRSITENNKMMILKSESERIKDNPIYIVFHLSETKYNVLLQCKLEDSLQDLKEIAYQKFESKVREKENCLKLIDEYVLEWTDSNVFLTDESIKLKDLPIFLTGIKIEHITLKERSQYELHRIKIKMINKLINAPYWDSSTESDIDEKTYFRKNIMRNTYIKARKVFQIPQMTRAPIPPYIPPKFKISFMIAPGISKAVGASPNSIVADIIEDAKKKLCLPKDKSYVMKICGHKEYIIDKEAQISKFEYIRKSLERDRGIYFQLIPCEDLGCIEDPVTKNIIPPWQQQSNLSHESKNDNETYEQDLDLAIIMSEINDDINFERPSETIRKLKSRSNEYIFHESPPLLNTDSLWQQRRYFEVKIYQIRNLVLGSSASSLNFTNVSFYVEVGLYYGGEPLIEPKTTNRIPWESPLIWDEFIVFDRLCLRNIPLETRICFTLYGKDRNTLLPLANVSLKLFDHHKLLITGKQEAYMWLDDHANPIGFCGSNLHAKEKEQNVLELMFDETPFPVKYTESSEIPDLISSIPEPTEKDEIEMIKLLGMDSLWYPSSNEKKLLWKFRYWIFNNYPNSLSKLALCVPWTNPIQLKEFWKLLEAWPKIEPKFALELLDARYADFRLRKYVVRSLQALTDQELSLYLLQLVQVLKYELYHYTPLALFLVERALENEIGIGIPLFWYLKSELHNQENSERFGLMLEVLLNLCSDDFREEISKQIKVVDQLRECAVKIKTIPENKRNKALEKLLSEIELPDKFTLPLDPVKELGKIDVSKCKCFDSAKAPILISFCSADPLWEEKYNVIFKEGDDLRQDALTLQMLTLMDQIWKMSNLDLHMTPYKVSITGYNTGLIEVVPDSKTTAAIQKESGITLAAFSEKPLRNWFEEKASSQSAFMSIVDNFVLSCAGYCVLTYVLGIGDRHNSNIMVDIKGHLFHIDFGHFLGNYKSWKGIWDREKAPFVLTPEFAYVMDGKDSDNFKYFIRQCVRAYNIVRKEGNFILTLFTMMLSTGIPELKSAADLLYLRDSLSQDLTDEEAQDKFIQLIEQSLKCKTTQLNGFFHLLAH